ncbi:MAG: DUF4407 domain-containing protein [Bacteroidota bacterium]
MKDIKEEPKKRKMGFFYRFFCWCSGARLYLLKECESEYNKFFGIGAIVLLTAVMAAVTGIYALYTVFSNLWIAVPFGIFWGVTVFFLDWFIVASLKKEKRFSRELIAAIPRIILAILIAVVISKPLELKLFEKEILGELAMMNQEKQKEYKTMVEGNYEEIQNLKKENEQYQNQIDKKAEERQELFNMIIAEAEGRSPTNKEGKGPVYKEKKAEFEKVDEEYSQLFKRNNKLIDENKEKINKLENQRDDQIYSEDRVAGHTGFLGRLKALNSLAESNKSVYYANLFIVFLFIVVESAPMIVKLMSSRGPYDVLLEAEEKEKNAGIQAQLVQQELSLEEEKTLYTDIKRQYLENKRKNETESMDNAFKAKKEMDEKRLQKWKEKQDEEIENNPEELKNLDDLLGSNIKIISD